MFGWSTAWFQCRLDVIICTLNSSQVSSEVTFLTFQAELTLVIDCRSTFSPYEVLCLALVGTSTILIL